MHKTQIIESTDGDFPEKSSRSVVTKTVEKTGGCRTTTTTLRSVTKDGLDAALSRLDVDPEKFRSGGTTVTKTIIYTDSSGKKEVIEETVENYGDPDKLAKEFGRKDFVKEFKTVTQNEVGKMGACLGKSSANTSPTKTADKCPTTKVDPKTIKPGKFEDDCLRAHNEYRVKHGVPPLVLSKEICAYSKEWVDHLAATDTFKHRTQDKKRYGENIFMKWSSDPNHTIQGNEPVDSWYSEIKDHIFGKEPRSLKSGHFTQVIWKESKSLGVAWARSKTGKILVVANYDPAGNFIGNFTQNVPPPKK